MIPRTDLLPGFRYELSGRLVFSTYGLYAPPVCSVGPSAQGTERASELMNLPISTLAIYLYYTHGRTMCASIFNYSMPMPLGLDLGSWTLFSGERYLPGGRRAPVAVLSRAEYKASLGQMCPLPMPMQYGDAGADPNAASRYSPNIGLLLHPVCKMLQPTRRYTHIIG